MKDHKLNHCPRCEVPLEAESYEGIQVDRCSACNGVFLDEGELRHIKEVREETFTSEERAAVAGIEEIVDCDYTETSGEEIPCPMCKNSPMTRLDYAATSGVVIDRCPGCGGIWLDEGELEKIQILVEGWEEKQGEDLAQWSKKMQAIEERIENQFDEADPYGASKRSSMARTLLSGVFGFFLKI